MGFIKEFTKWKSAIATEKSVIGFSEKKVKKVRDLKMKDNDMSMEEYEFVNAINMEVQEHMNETQLVT